jgi:hypothetical protein
LIRTSKESAREDVCAAQIYGAISAAETISALANAKNPYRLIILFVLLLRRCLLDYPTQTEISGRAKGPAKRFMLILSAQFELIHWT